MIATKVWNLVSEAAAAFIVVFYFSCYGMTGSFSKTFVVMWKLLRDTLSGRNLFPNYFGLTISQLGYTIRLILLSLLISLVVGLFLTIVRLRLQKSPLRFLFEIVSAIFEAIPEPMYVVLLAVFVLFMMNRFQIYFIPVFMNGPPSFADTIAPSITLALPGAFYMERTLYLKLRDEVKQQYVHTALSKGASLRRVFYRHVLPNGLSVVLRQMPVVEGMVISSALFAEFFLGYRGALSEFTFATGWNMVTGIYQGFEKPFQLPLYQPGLVFLIGSFLVILWFLSRIGFEVAHSTRYGRSK